MKKFEGNMEPGEVFGPYVVRLNSRRRREAVAFQDAHSGKLEGYLNGKYRRGWLVLARRNTTSATTNQRTSL